MRRICQLCFVNTTFKVGPSAPAERHQNRLPAGESQPQIDSRFKTSFVCLVFCLAIFSFIPGYVHHCHSFLVDARLRSWTCSLRFYTSPASHPARYWLGATDCPKVDAQKLPEQSKIRKYRVCEDTDTTTHF